MRKGIEPRLLGSLIERGMPISDEPLEITDIGAVSPWLSGCLIGIPRPRQPFAQIGDGLVGNGEGEVSRLSCHLCLCRMQNLGSCYLLPPHHESRNSNEIGLARPKDRKLVDHHHLGRRHQIRRAPRFCIGLEGRTRRVFFLGDEHETFASPRIGFRDHGGLSVRP